MFLDLLNKPSSFSALTILGMSPITFYINSSEISQVNSWIIDTGATDHMTPHSQYFKTYKQCPKSNQKIRRAKMSVSEIGID